MKINDYIVNAYPVGAVCGFCTCEVSIKLELHIPRKDIIEKIKNELEMVEETGYIELEVCGEKIKFNVSENMLKEAKER